ncbi:MAG TPA: DUF4845 domain-containing protein [Ramlibacter sp.]|uniref:DUF4845 domain-containing protein n=1 Tax=Ramlibacter sp. TaxID=1917967 RepID=UPI002D7F8FAC|nr:DUF4845 domain-containing protein [Ramlibacter sp.]HET8745365.1 DUF4845 domain-containing protein [Ramlibacter sp.]
MAGKSRQRGISLLTLIFFLAVIGAVGAVGMRAFPSILEYQAALKAINRAKDEGTVAGVRAAFDRAAQVDNITSISGKDLEVTKDGDKVVVSFAYDKEFHLFGPAWLTLKYEGSSRPGR